MILRVRCCGSGDDRFLKLYDGNGAPKERPISKAKLERLLGIDWPAQGADAVVVGKELAGVLFDDVASAPWQALELEADGAEDELLTLPWELVSDPAKPDTPFLAARGWGVVRIVAEDAAPAAVIPAPARLLVVVGTQPNDPEIRPGAEYLSVLRTVDGIRMRLLLNANQKSLAAAVSDFQPDVVHFICHGGIQKGAPSAPYLELTDEASPTQRKRLFADALCAALRRPDATLPPAVVLNACYTADGKAGFALGSGRSPALAAQLVQRGVQFAVGHAGDADDQVCRLLTRRLYESLAQGRDVIADLGRIRMELLRDVGPHSTHWATVRFFARAEPRTAEDAPGPVRELRVCETQRATRWATCVVKSVPHAAVQPPFCGRSELIAKFDTLLSSDNVQLAVQRRFLRYLILQSFAGTESRDFGRTYALREIWRRAAKDGHLAVPLRAEELGQQALDRDKPLLPIVMHILDRLESSAINFNVNVGDNPWTRSPEPDTAAFGKGTNALCQYAAQNFDSVISALSGATFNSAPLLVLLIDDLHALGPGLLDAFFEFMSHAHVRNVSKLRLIATFESQNPDAVSNRLKSFNENEALAHVHELKDFADEVETDLTHLQFLLSCQLKNTPQTLIPTDKNDVLRVFRKKSRGPNDLRYPDGKAWEVTEYCLDFDKVKDQDDEGRLRALAALGML